MTQRSRRTRRTGPRDLSRHHHHPRHLLRARTALRGLLRLWLLHGQTLRPARAQRLAEVTTRSENSTSKPAPGSLASPALRRKAQPTAEPQSAIVPLDSPNAAERRQSAAPLRSKQPPQAHAPTRLPKRRAKPASKPAGIIPVAAALSSPGSSVVQVAAMSHQEDADVVAARPETPRLRRRHPARTTGQALPRSDRPLCHEKRSRRHAPAPTDRRLQQRHRQIAAGFISGGNASAIALLTAAISSSRVSYFDGSIAGST